MNDRPCPASGDHNRRKRCTRTLSIQPSVGSGGGCGGGDARPLAPNVLSAPAAIAAIAAFARITGLSCISGIANVVPTVPTATQLDELLCACAATNNADACEALLRRGADPDAIEPRTGACVLTLAAHGGSDLVCRILMAAGANPEGTFRGGNTSPPRPAPGSTRDTVPAATLSLSLSSITPLMIAVTGSHASTCAALLQGGACPNRGSGKGDMRPLCVAAHSNDLAVCQMLIAHGADVHASGDNGIAPLWIAARGGSVDVCRALVAAGACLRRSADLSGWTPVHVAAQVGGEEVLRFLLQTFAGRDTHTLRDMVVVTNARTRHDRITPLMAASKVGNARTCEMLLMWGADPHARTKRGMTALGTAVAHGWLDVCDVLLRFGADPNDRPADDPAAEREVGSKGAHANGTHDTRRARATPVAAPNCVRPLYIAVTRRHLQMCELLLRAGADPNQTHDTWTPMHAAAHCGHVEICQALIRSGAVVHAVTSTGVTPFHIALAREDMAMCLTIVESLRASCPLPPCKHAGVDLIHVALGASDLYEYACQRSQHQERLQRQTIGAARECEIGCGEDGQGEGQSRHGHIQSHPLVAFASSGLRESGRGGSESAVAAEDCAAAQTAKPRNLTSASVSASAARAAEFHPPAAPSSHVDVFASCAFKQACAIECLLRYVGQENADRVLNAKDVLGRTSLDIAIISGKRSAFRALVRHGARVSANTIRIAKMFGATDLIRESVAGMAPRIKGVAARDVVAFSF